MCFKNMDGRIGDAHDDKKSVKSQVSRAVSIRARNNTMVSYGLKSRNETNVNQNKAQAQVMQSFAISLR